MKGKEFAAVAKATVREFGQDDVGNMAAALTYYTFFSIFPLILLGVTLSSVFLKPIDAEQFIFSNVSRVLPGSVKLIQGAFDEALKNRNNAGILAVAGVLVLLITASGAFDALDKALNRAFNSEKMRGVVATKIASFGMMLAFGALSGASVLVSAGLAFAESYASGGGKSGVPLLWQVANSAGTVAVMLIGLLLLYRFVPRVPLTFRDVYPGAILAALLWEIAKEAFGFYLGSSLANYSAVYGTLGTVIALLTWIYVSSVIILVGAEFSAETARVRSMRAKVLGENPDGTPRHRRSPWLDRRPD